MLPSRFTQCLAVTLKWEGGYSNHPDDPGGKTMRGVTQEVYDTYRRAKRKKRQHVRHVTEAEVLEIYRTYYWEAADCEPLPDGLDLVVFDAAVNSGVGRSKQWLADERVVNAPDTATKIRAYCEIRLAFLRGLKTWRVFGRGWTSRVNGIEVKALSFLGQPQPAPAPDNSLHAGMRGTAVSDLQTALRRLGYPCGAVDGIFGEQLRRAVILFQDDHSLEGEKGVWLPAYNAVLADAKPVLPKREGTTAKDLAKAGDTNVARLNLVQRLLAWIFGASAAGQVLESDSVVGGVTAFKTLIEPLQGVLAWASSNKWALLAVAAIVLIAIVRAIRAQIVSAYQNFSYQGDINAQSHS